jgi:RNA polymerase sigma-70 factor (ECF subfamily)
MTEAKRSFEEALPGLLRDVAPKVRALALRMCRDPHDADDLVQEVFLQAQRKWGSFEGRAAPGTWMYVIAARLCRGRHRRRFGGRDTRMPALSQVTPFAESTVSAAGLNESPLARAEEREGLEAVQGAIVRMPQQFRVPFVLSEVFELPVSEVAAALKLKPETVRTRVHRARLLVRRELLSAARRRPAPKPEYERKTCIDLLAAKLASLDEGVEFRQGDEVMCRRCRAVFHELDLVRDACSRLAAGSLPASLREAIRRQANEKAGTAGAQRASQKRPTQGSRGGRDGRRSSGTGAGDGRSMAQGRRVRAGGRPRS